MKTAIITIIDRNYGNRLQNYALNFKLLKMGCQVKTISIPAPKFFLLKTTVKVLLALLFPKFRRQVKDILRRRADSRVWDDFDRLISWEPMTVEGNAQTLVRCYDVFITGSDQVWNWHFAAGDRELLAFAPKEKRASYAASLGVSELPLDQQERFRDQLKNFSFISVREHAGAAIIKMLIKKNVPVVLDPTMLLSADDWRRVMRKPSIQPEGKYIFKYLLGERNPAYERYIEDFALEHGCSIIDINRPGNMTLRGIGPAEFVSLIEGCSYACIDSFHGSVFSILFHKPFLILDREGNACTGDMSSRMDTLLRHFDLGNRLVRNVDDLAAIRWNMDYSRVDSILAEKQKDAEVYLKQVLEIR